MRGCIDYLYVELILIADVIILYQDDASMGSNSKAVTLGNSFTQGVNKELLCNYSKSFWSFFIIINN